MAIPQYPKKYDQEVIISPRQHFLAEKEHYEDFDVPKSVILCFESSLMNHFKAQDEMESVPFWTGEMLYFPEHHKQVALVGNFGIGGPAAGQMLEILIAAGVEEFVVVGHAGGLQKSNPIGTIVLSNKAVRDEGLSHHYLKPEKYACPSPQLTDRLKKKLTESDVPFQTGGSWTIDSMYRETKDEIRHYAEEEIATVEMELASLFAVASFRKVNIAALLVISDYVSFEHWDQHFHANATFEALMKATAIAKDTLIS